LKGINPIQWATWTLFTKDGKECMSLGKGTSNNVEQEMNRFKKLGLRSSTPLKFFQKLTELWRKLYEDGKQNARAQVNHGMTNYSYKLFQQQDEEARSLTCNRSGNGSNTYIDVKPNTLQELHLYEHLSKKQTSGVDNIQFSKRFIWNVQYNNQFCDCRFWQMYGIICSHGLKAFDEEFGNSLIMFSEEDLLIHANHKIHECWFRSTYKKCYSDNGGINLVTKELIGDVSIVPLESLLSKKVGPVRSKR